MTPAFHPSVSLPCSLPFACLSLSIFSICDCWSSKAFRFPPPGFFKEVISVLEPSVPGLINSSLSSGVVPKTFKHATLLIKNPAWMPLLSNFRPVSKPPSFQRFWRELFIASGQPFKIKYDVFEVFQSNFKCLHDTESALMRVFWTSSWLKIHSSSPVDMGSLAQYVKPTVF